MCKWALWLPAMAVWALSSSCWGQEAGASALQMDGMPDQVARIMESQQNAWNRGDLVGFMDGYLKSDSLMFIGKSGVTYGHGATLQRYKTSYPDKQAMGALTFVNRTWIALGPNAGWLMGEWALDRTDAEDASGMYTLLWRNIQGQWVIVADHSS